MMPSGFGGGRPERVLPFRVPDVVSLDGYIPIDLTHVWTPDIQRDGPPRSGSKQVQNLIDNLVNGILCPVPR